MGKKKNTKKSDKDKLANTSFLLILITAVLNLIAKVLEMIHKYI